jgi:hypothetical protein
MQNQVVHLLHTVLTTLLRAVRAIFLSIPLAGILAAGAVEGISAAVTHQFPGSLVTHVLAAAFGIVVAYASALTLAVIEATRGGIYLARMLERDFSHEASTLDKTIQGFGQRIIGRR